MDDVKSALASKTLWGAIVAGAATVAGFCGVNLSDAQQTLLINGLSALGTLIGLGVVFYGRLHANTRIGGIITADPSKATAPSAPSTIILPPGAG